MKALISLFIIFITMPLSAKELYRDQQPLKLFCQISLIDKVKIELPNIDLKGTSYNCLPLKGDSSLLSKCNLWNDQFPIEQYINIGNSRYKINEVSIRDSTTVHSSKLNMSHPPEAEWGDENFGGFRIFLKLSEVDTGSNLQIALYGLQGFEPKLKYMNHSTSCKSL